MQNHATKSEAPLFPEQSASTALDELKWQRLTVPPLPAWPDRAQPVWFDITGNRAPVHMNGDVQLLAHLLPAMAIGRSLQTPSETSSDPDLPPQIERASAILSHWHPKLRPIRVIPAAAPSAPFEPQGERGIGCFFTGGADSFRTLQRNLDPVDSLVFVFGYDIRDHQPQLAADTLAMLQEVTSVLGKRLILIRTNLRQATDPILDWGGAHGVALAAVARLLQDELAEIHLASSFTHGALIPWGSHPQLDQCWSTPRQLFHHDGADETRWQKIEALLEWHLAMDHLRVCTWNTGDTYNCGRCSKCLRTMAALHLIDGEGQVKTMPPKVDLADIASLAIKSVAEIPFVNELIEEADRRGSAKAPLASALRTALERAELGDNLPPEHLAEIPPPPLKPSMVSWIDGPDHIEARVLLEWHHKRETLRIKVSAPADLLPRREDLADALLCWCAPLAMFLGVPLVLPQEMMVDPMLLANIRRSMPLMRLVPPWRDFRTVEIQAEERALETSHSDGRYFDEVFGCAFSGGIDACALATTLQPAPRLLLYVHGIDAGRQGEERRQRLEKRIRALAEVAAPRSAVVFLDTNLRAALSEGFGLPWSTVFRGSLHGGGQLLARHINGFVIASDDTIAAMFASVPFSSGNSPIPFEIFSGGRQRQHYWDDGGTRSDRLKAISRVPGALAKIWFCMKEAKGLYHGEASNCGVCEKCVRTAFGLRLQALPVEELDLAQPFDSSRIDAIDRLHGMLPAIWREMLDAPRPNPGPQPEIEAAERLLARSVSAADRSGLDDLQLASLRKHPGYPRWLKLSGEPLARAVFSDKPTRWLRQWLEDRRGWKRVRGQVLDELLRNDEQRVTRWLSRARWKRRLGLKP